MTLHDVLAEGRAAANARMTETVVAGIYTDGTDPVTLEPTRVLVQQVYPVPPATGVAWIKYPSLSVAEREGPSMPVQKQTPELRIPHGSPVLPEGTEVHVTASTIDPTLVGRRYKVTGAPQAGQTTSLRHPLEEVS